MRIRVRLAEPFWRAVGARNLELDLPDGSHVADLLDLMSARHPEFGRELDETAPHVFIGEEEADSDSLLAEGAEVHLVWPVAGG